jgi:hypothetical protein
VAMWWPRQPISFNIIRYHLILFQRGFRGKLALPRRDYSPAK